MFKSQNFKALPLCLGVILAISLVNYLVLAWTEPSQAPPGGNVNAPINVGNTGQSKAGGLILNTGGAVTGLIVDKGNILVNEGNVGIGTSSPSQKLEVGGKIIASQDICLSSGICLSQVASLIGSQKMVGNAHTYKQCTDAGGEVVDIGLATPVCRFNASDCPGDWRAYENWSTTITGASCGCSGQGRAGNYCYCPPCSCTVNGFHSWSNTNREYCKYAGNDQYGQCALCAYGGLGATCWQTRSQIGCY